MLTVGSLFSSSDSEDEEVIPVLPPDPGVVVEKEDKKPNILEEAANKVLNFVKEAAKKITQVVNKSNETSSKTGEKGVAGETQDKNKQSIVTLIGKEENEDGAVAQTENQTVNGSIEQLGITQTLQVNNKDPNNALGETVFAAHQQESKTMCSAPSPYERFLHILGGGLSISRCGVGRKLHKLTSPTSTQGMKVTPWQDLPRKSPVVSKLDQEDEVDIKEKKVEKNIKCKITTIDKASSSVTSSVEEQLLLGLVSSSRDTNSKALPSLQNQESKQTDSKQKPVTNQTVEKILITTFIQPSQAKEIFSKRPAITLPGSETPQLSSVVAVTVKPGNSTLTTTSSSSAETLETAVVESDKPGNTPEHSAVLSDREENVEEEKVKSSTIEQQPRKPATDDKTPPSIVSAVKPNNEMSQNSVTSDSSKPEPSTESKEKGCEAQTDAIAMQSSSVSQCSAVNSIEMMQHPIPGVDVLEIKLADGDKEATALPQQPENDTKKDATLETEQKKLSEENPISKSSVKAKAKLGEATVDKDGELVSGFLDSAKVLASEALPSTVSAADKLVESIPPIAAPPVEATKDVVASPASSPASAATPSSVVATAVNDEQSASSVTGGGTAAEVPGAADTSFDAHYSSSIDKMAAQMGSSSSAPSSGSVSGGTQKESIFLRLSNKIKALEQNLTLSTRYMEQLNQR